MAKKKKTHTKRRVSGTGKQKDVIMNAFLLVGGAVGGKILTNFATKQFGDKVTPEIAGAAQVALGLFLLPKFVKGNAGTMVGYGLAVNGGLTLAEKLNLPGMAGMPLIGYGPRMLPRRMNGPGNNSNGNGSSTTTSMAIIGELERCR